MDSPAPSILTKSRTPKECAEIAFHKLHGFSHETLGTDSARDPLLEDWPENIRLRMLDVLIRYLQIWWKTPDMAHEPISKLKHRMQGKRVDQNYDETLVAHGYTSYYYLSYVAQACLSLKLNRNRLIEIIEKNAL